MKKHNINALSLIIKGVILGGTKNIAFKWGVKIGWNPIHTDFCDNLNFTLYFFLTCLHYYYACYQGFKSK
jgi:hypothetical protein